MSSSSPRIPWLNLKADAMEIKTSDGKPAFIPKITGKARKKLGYVFGEYENLGRGYYSIETRQGHALLLQRLRVVEAEAKKNERAKAKKTACCCFNYDRRTPWAKERDKDLVMGKQTMRAFVEARLKEGESPVAAVSRDTVAKYGGKATSRIFRTWSPSQETVENAVFFAYDIGELWDGGDGG